MNFPEIRKRDSIYFELESKLPENYFELVRKVDDNFKEILNFDGIDIMKECGLNTFNNHYPVFKWDGMKGLVSIVIGGSGKEVEACLSDSYDYEFSFVETSNQALALLNIISTYLNNLRYLETA